MTTLTVGKVGQQFVNIADAVAASHDGDIIKVQAGTYVNDFAQVTKSVALEAVGGMVHLKATRAPDDGKAILTVGASGKSISITGFELSGAAVGDGNGAGVRYQGGHLLLESVYIHDNQDGLLANSDPAGTVTIRNSEFSRNGAGDGQTHNIYVNTVAQLTVDGVYSHDAVLGHELKSRAEATTVVNSRFYDNDGTASYSIDLPVAGKALIRNNVIEQGPNSQNPTIIAYGEEGWKYGMRPNTSLTVEGNTIVNDLNSSSSRLLWNATSTTATVSNNTVFGLTADQIITSGSASVTGTTFLGGKPTLDRSSPLTSTGASDDSSESVGSLSATQAAHAPGGSGPIDADGFDATYYLAHNPDVKAAGVDAHAHFDQYGWREGRSPDALFDVGYYLSHNPDVAAAGVNPLQHYSNYGWHEGRDSSAQFDTAAYLGAYKDVAAAGVNPLYHYLQHGAAEGRSSFPVS